MRVHFGGDATIKKSRTDEIMGDAAYEIITSDSRHTTDKFFVDDEVLAGIGVTDLKKYRVDPNCPEHELLECGLC